jgi:cell division septal protein FtsQ
MASPRRRPKVTLRKSRVVYRRRMIAQSVWLWGRTVFYLALGVWLASTAYAFWLKAPVFQVQGVVIDPGAPAGLEKKLGLEAGDHFFRLQPELAEERLRRAYPELTDVRVRRRWWDRRVRVSFRRRSIMARAFDGQRWFGMDKDGAPFPLPEGAAANAPILAGATGPSAAPVLDFMARLARAPAAWVKRVQKVKASPSGSLMLYLDDGTPVFWGDRTSDGETIGRKARRLERVLHDESLAGGAQYIRFVDDARIAVKPAAPKDEDKEPSGGKS